MPTDGKYMSKEEKRKHEQENENAKLHRENDDNSCENNNSEKHCEEESEKNDKHAENGKKSCEKEYCDKIAELEKKLAESQKSADEFKASWYRTAADFDNFKKRNSETRANAYADGKGDVIKSILVIGDNLDRALASAVEEKTREGIELVIRQFKETLKNLGVEEIDPVGEKFDPNLHEAVHQVEAGEGDESGTIKQVFRKGYSLNGKMIRYAQVIVIK